MGCAARHDRSPRAHVHNLRHNVVLDVGGGDVVLAEQARGGAEGSVALDAAADASPLLQRVDILRVVPAVRHEHARIRINIAPQQLVLALERGNEAVARRRLKGAWEDFARKLEERLRVAQEIVHAEHGLRASKMYDDACRRASGRGRLG